jgi:hypothetical protein
MILRILLRQINFGSFLMIAARSIILAIIFSDATSLTMVIRALGSPAPSSRLSSYFSLVYWCCVFLPMVIDYFNGCTRARSLGIAS